jgi:hypothetical protein
MILFQVLQLCMRAQNCFVITVFLTKNTLCVCQEHTNCVVEISSSLLWQVTVTILLAVISVLLFSLLMAKVRAVQCAVTGTLVKYTSRGN